MARKKSKKKSRKKKGPSGKTLNLREEIINTVTAIVFFVISVFLLLAPLGLGGVVGDRLYSYLGSVLGSGYYLFPLMLLLLSISYLKSKRPALSLTRILGSVVAFISTLAILSISLPGFGGAVGGFVSSPLITLFDVYASLLILWALVFTSLIVMFDTKPSAKSFKNIIGLFNRLFRSSKDSNLDSFGEGDNMHVNIPEEDEVEEKGGGDDSERQHDDKTDKEKDPDKKDPGGSEEGDEGIFNIFKRKESDSEYSPPPLKILKKRKGKPDVGDIKANANLIKRTLQNFGIDVEMDEVSVGPTVTRYALKPAEGVRLSKIIGLQNNLELALAAHPVRIEAPIPGKSLVGIEVPNNTKKTVGIYSILSSKQFQSSPHPMTIALGRGVSGNNHTANISKMPHMLIAGATGSGKSVTIHNIITSLIYRNSPEDLKFIMVDPKRVELTLYNGIPHLLTPVITDAKKTILALKWAAQEMERRYDILEESKVRDIFSYHKEVLGSSESGDEESGEGPAPMPYIVVIIDELADIMQAYPRELESAVVRLAQMSRAVGIHLVLSTQRPSVNVITGLIKANIPARIALQVASGVDSRTILDSSGAEKLLGAGDMLYLSGDMSKPVRIQSAFISEREVKDVVGYLKKTYQDSLNEEVTLTSEEEQEARDIFEAAKEMEAEEDEDELYEEAREIVIKADKGSTSYLQRKLSVGYARAARIMDSLEERGVVGPQEGSKPREVLVRKDQEENHEEHEEG